MSSASAAAPFLSIIGIGEDGLDGLSLVARAALGSARIVYGGMRHLRLAEAAITGEARRWPTPIEAAFPEIAALGASLWLCSRAVIRFTTASAAFLPRICRKRQLPQLSKGFEPVARGLAPRLALQDCLIVSLHGRPLESVLPQCHASAQVLVLCWDERTLPALGSLLEAHGLGDTPIHVLEALDGPNERIFTTTAATAANTRARR